MEFKVFLSNEALSDVRRGVSSTGDLKLEITGEAVREPLPLSVLNDYLYCARRAGLKVLEGWRQANVHTERGDIVHEHTDLAGYEVVKGATLLRALPVWSERLGLNGKCDIVERRPDGTWYPVEFKLGKRRQWENDDAQLCAEALCLEEMLGVQVARGAVFHAESKRRREVEFSTELRQRTEEAVAELHRLLDLPTAGGGGQLPPAVFRPACEECSLFDVCLPKATEGSARAKRLAKLVFETE